jgi:hypothetical protein
MVTSKNLISSQFPLESNFDLLLSFPQLIDNKLEIVCIETHVACLKTVFRLRLEGTRNEVLKEMEKSGVLKPLA